MFILFIAVRSEIMTQTCLKFHFQELQICFQWTSTW